MSHGPAELTLQSTFSMHTATTMWSFEVKLGGRASAVRDACDVHGIQPVR